LTEAKLIREMKAIRVFWEWMRKSPASANAKPTA
jgi:hypothetical protein